MLNRILVPIDYEQAESAIPSCALDLAERHQAELHLLYIVDVGNTTQKSALLPGQDHGVEPIADYQVTVRREVCQGTLTETVIDYVRQQQIDMVVVDRRTSGMATQRSLVMAISELSEKVECPIVLTRPRGTVTELEAMNKAVALLTKEFGRRLKGQHEATRDQIRAVLEKQMQIEQQEAEWVAGGFDFHGNGSLASRRHRRCWCLVDRCR